MDKQRVREIATLLIISLSLSSCQSPEPPVSSPDPPSAVISAEIPPSPGQAPEPSFAQTPEPSPEETPEEEPDGPYYAENDLIDLHNMVTLDMYNRSIAGAGNKARLKRVLQKAEDGGNITLGYIGGSITEGSGAGPAGTPYADLITQWWQNTFPQAGVAAVNAGVSATGSIYGVSRIDRDLLCFDPDVVFVEFSVNDYRNEPLAQEAYEGLIRKALSMPNQPAVVLIFMSHDDGSNEQAVHSEVGRHYRLPMISYRDAIWPEVRDDPYAWYDFSFDSVHPNANGHAVVQALVCQYIESVRRGLGNVDTIPSLPAPLTENRLESAMLYDSANFTPDGTPEWQAADNAHKAWKNSWLAQTPGSSISFSLEAKTVTIAYLKSHKGMGGKALLSVDGAQYGILDAHVGGFFSYAAFYTIIDKKEAGTHSFELTMLEDAAPESQGGEFYLLSIIVS